MDTSVYIEKRKTKAGGPTYRITWRDAAGKRRRIGCGRDRTLAKELRAQKQVELRRDILGDKPVVTIKAFRERLPELMAGRARHTIRHCQLVLELVEDTCKIHLLDEITRCVLMSFRARRLKNKRSTATINRNLRELKAALSYAVDAGLLKHNCMLRWRAMTIREPDRVVRIVSVQEYRKLIKACHNETLAALLTLAYRTGMRRAELCNLRWLGDSGQPLVDFGKELVHIVNRPGAGELTKSRKMRVVHLHHEASAALQALWQQSEKAVRRGVIQTKHAYVFCRPSGKRYKPDWVSAAFPRVVEDAGVEHCTLHDFRRSWATNLLDAGVDKSVVKDLGGWSCISVLERFYQGDLTAHNIAAMKRAQA